LWIFCITGLVTFSQSYSSKNNYTGAWETPTSWIPTWPVPQSDFNGDDIAIFGYIMTTTSISISNSSTLTINDTLVIEGDLSLGDHTVLTINDNGILIIRGNLFIDDHTILIANGYLIVTGGVTKTHSIDHGSFTSNDNPVKVFIGGTISPITLTENNPTSPIFNCTVPPTIPYPNSTCSHGNLTDFLNDPLYPFFQSACIIATPTITAGGPTTFCEGGSVTLTSSAGSTYLWSTGATTSSINVTTSGNYTVQVTNANGCQSPISGATVIKIDVMTVPIPGVGGNECDFDFQLQATPSVGTGPGVATFSPSINDPNAIVLVDMHGSYQFTWTETNGICSDDSTILVNFYEQPVANAGIGGNECDLDFILQAEKSVGSGSWIKKSGPGDADFSPSADDPDATVSVNSYGVYEFTWITKNGICSDQSTIVVTFFEKPDATATAPDNVCGLSTELYASLSTGIGIWKKSFGPGNAIFGSTTDLSIRSVTVDEYGTYEFTWTETNAICSDSVKVIVNVCKKTLK